jgi:hypothetical protein
MARRAAGAGKHREELMPNLPESILHDVAVQNNATGAVDYLQFKGSTLVASDMIDYGIGAGFKVVAHGDFNTDGHQDLVVQNSQGFVDFLFLDANAHLVGSAMSSSALPAIVGGGVFGSSFGGQTGPTLVSQLSNGQLDFLGFNASGAFIHSDLLANTVGLAQATAVGESNAHFPTFFNNGTGGTDNVFLHLADGSVDALGFSGNFSDASLSFSASLLLPGSAGTGVVGQVNPDFGGNTNESIRDSTTGVEGVETVSMTADGHINLEYFDSGYNDTANEGTLYASNLLVPGFGGNHVIDAGSIVHNDLFPIV